MGAHDLVGATCSLGRVPRAEGMSLIDGAASGTFSEGQGATITRRMGRDEMVWAVRRGAVVERAGCAPYLTRKKQRCARIPSVGDDKCDEEPAATEFGHLD